MVKGIVLDQGELSLAKHSASTCSGAAFFNSHDVTSDVGFQGQLVKDTCLYRTVTSCITSPVASRAHLLKCMCTKSEKKDDVGGRLWRPAYVRQLTCLCVLCDVCVTRQDRGKSGKLKTVVRSHDCYIT